MKSKMKVIAFITAIMLMAIPGFAQPGSIPSQLNMYVFPANDQDAEQQEFDEYKCYTWAKEQSGIDPISIDVQVEVDQSAGKGNTVRGAAGGAAAGAAVGAIAGDAGKGAAIGATLGAFRGLRSRAYSEQRAEAQAQQQATAQEEALMTSFKNAYAACLEGKGYTVKF
jgi:hypothetical protein